MSGWFYRAFEDRYRGSRDIIRERLQVYLPFVQPLAQGGGAALDLGCGRGEWLELLNEAGLAAEGVDLDEGMLAACRERGLSVFNGDALAALRARPDASLAVVSAFHLVEHIAFDLVQELIAESLRVLQPGGILIMETPNPENLVVGASSFYDDPSHLRPVPPKLLAFAVDFSGFGRHKVLRLQEAEHLRGAPDLGLFDVLGGVSPDYGVVAQKAGAPAWLAAFGDRFDALFDATYGVDLHTLAQRYQQRQDAVRGELGQLREAQTANGAAVQQQLAEVDTQIAHVHATTVALAERLDQADRARQDAAGPGEAETLAERLDRIEALARRAETAATGGGGQSVERLRARIGELQELQQGARDESTRLAAHVAWIEGRLTHSEAEAAALRHQLGELQRRRVPGMRLARALRRRVRTLAGPGGGQRLRQPAYALLRRIVQGVLRRPALKRVARNMVLRFPHLHTRLLRLMYAPAPVDPATLADADPLASEMSPRSLTIYRALLAASKHKD